MSICLHIYGKDEREISGRMEKIGIQLREGFTSGEMWDVEEGIDLKEMKL